jgi:2-dehydropantoate 2-reductase
MTSGRGPDALPDVRRGRSRGIFWRDAPQGWRKRHLSRAACARAAQLKRDGLVIKTQDGGRTPHPGQQGQLDGTYDVILLCCKAYAIAPAMNEQSVIAPVLNGVRHIDVLTERFGPGRVLGGLTVINAPLMPDGTIQQSQVRINLNIIGELDGRASARCTAIRSALDAGGIPTQISDNIRAMMWAKFFGFVCSATIATLTRSRAGAIAKSASGASFVSAVIEECARVVTAAGYPPAPPPAPDTAGLTRGLFSQLDLWAVHTDRHGRRRTHRGRTHHRRYGGTRGAG